MAVSAACAEGSSWEGMWPFLDPWDVVGLRTTASVWNVPKEYGPYSELFFFLFEEGADNLREGGGPQTLGMAGPLPMKRVNTAWRTSCCALVRSMRAVCSCKGSHTRKSCVRWL